MKKEKNTTRLNGKDLLNVGIFTAVYFVLNLLVAAVLGLIPAVSMLVPLVSSFILGIPMMLYFMKIKKFGMVLITYIVYGVFACTGRCWNLYAGSWDCFCTDCRVVIAFWKIPETESGDSCFCDCQHWCKWECPLYGVGKYRVS